MQTGIGLALALASAIAVNWAYAIEHDAAAALPPFSVRRPREFVRSLLGARDWLRGFAIESAGWLVYVAALRLAPISLVQAVGAAGIAALAFASAHGRPSRLARREQAAAAFAVAGFVLLGFSLVDTHQTDRPPAWHEAAFWLGSTAGAAAAVAASRGLLAPGPGLGIAAGLLFAGGDISAKLVVYGGWWLAAMAALVAFYGLGTTLLQGAYQKSDALTAAGLATLVTNAVPIGAGFVVFDERLPHGTRGTLEVAAFATLVVSAALLAHPPGRPRG